MRRYRCSCLYDHIHICDTKASTAPSNKKEVAAQRQCWTGKQKGWLVFNSQLLLFAYPAYVMLEELMNRNR